MSLTINITVLVIVFLCIIWMTAPWKKSIIKENKKESCPINTGGNEAETEAIKIQNELKAKSDDVNDNDSKILGSSSNIKPLKSESKKTSKSTGTKKSTSKKKKD